MCETPWREGTLPQKIAQGATWSEGPLWIPSESVLRWSDIPGNRILQWDARSGQQTVWQENVEFTNGRALHPTHGVVQCSHGRRRIEIAGESPGAPPTALIERYNGKRFNSPNDIAVAPDGAIWFTDPPYGIVQESEGHLGEQEYGGCYVFRLSAKGELSAEITTLLRPNGLAFSPDGTYLYVTNTEAALEDGPGKDIWRFKLAHSGASVIEGSGCLFATPEEGLPDGIAVDAEGRVWSSGAKGVTVFSSQGTAVAFMPVPETVGNLCFGGADGSLLFIAATTGIYLLQTTTTGAH